MAVGVVRGSGSITDVGNLQRETTGDRVASVAASAASSPSAPAAIAEISSAGRLALASAKAAEPPRFQTTSPGHKTVSELKAAPAGTAAHEAAHVIQQAVRLAAGDLDGDGRSDIATNGPPAAKIINIIKEIRA